MQKWINIVIFIFIVGNCNAEIVSSFGVGGVTQVNYYKNNDSDSTYGIIILEIEGDNFFITEDEIGVYLANGEELKVGLILFGYGTVGYDGSGYMEGMKRDSFNYSGLSIEYLSSMSTEMTLKVMSDIFDDSNGTKFSIELGQYFAITDEIFFRPSIYLVSSNSNYSDYYYGVNSDEVRSDREEYNLKSTENTGITAALIYTNEVVEASIFSGIEYFDEKIKNSPVIKEDESVYAGISFKWIL